MITRKECVGVAFRSFRICSRYASSGMEPATHQEPGKLMKQDKPNRVRRLKPFKKHFIENLFIGKLDPLILEYPQLQWEDEVNYLKDHGARVESSLVNQIYSEELNPDGKITKDILENLRGLDVLGLKAPGKYTGHDYFEYESSYIQEAVATHHPALAKVLAENEDCGIQLLNFFGSQVQKDKYLTRLVSGNGMSCLAHFEASPVVKNNGVVHTVAIPSENGETFTIVGKKRLVYNAELADVIIFSAVIPDEKNIKKNFSLFVVDKRDLSGLKVFESVNQLGLIGANASEVIFDNVTITVDSVLGKHHNGRSMLEKILTKGKLSSGAQCCSILRRMINDIIQRTINQNLCGKPLFEYQHMHGEVGKLACKLYTLESMTYLMAGRSSIFENPDVFLESLIVKVFGSEMLLPAVGDYLQFIGLEGLKDKNVDRILRDSAFYMLFDDTNFNLKFLISKTGLKYSEQHRAIEHGGILKMYNEYKIRERHKDNYYVPGDEPSWYVHPSLEENAKHVYHCVSRFNYLIETLEKKYGSKIYEKKYELLQLADVATLIYAMVATLGRASRSYCIGLKNADLEIRAAHAITATCFRQIQTISLELTGDKLLKANLKSDKMQSIGKEILSCKKYKSLHPIRLKKNVVRTV